MKLLQNEGWKRSTRVREVLIKTMTPFSEFEQLLGCAGSDTDDATFIDAARKLVGIAFGAEVLAKLQAHQMSSESLFGQDRQGHKVVCVRDHLQAHHQILCGRLLVSAAEGERRTQLLGSCP
jgi:hypothetical protein